MAEFKPLYPEFGNLTYQNLLTGIDKDTLIKFATYLIGKNIFYKEPPANNTIIGEWFSEENKIFADDMARRIKEYEENEKKSLAIVYNISCLKVLQFGLELNEDAGPMTKSKTQSEIDLMLALLLLNQNEDYNQTKDTEKIHAEYDESLRPAALLLNFSFPNHDILNFDLMPYTICQVAKFLMLFQFLEGNGKGKSLIERFCHYYGITRWQDYILAVFPLILPWVEQGAGSVDIVLQKNDDYQKNLDFLLKFAMGEYAEKDDRDYIKLRDKPLIRIDETTFRAIHPVFIADKIYKGQFFLLKGLNDQEPKLIAEFRSWFTTNFSEGYCFVELVKYAFQNYTARYFDEDLKAQGITGPPDGYLRYDNDVFLFENKDILIGAKIKDSYDFESLTKELKKKLLKEGQRPVWIGQLLANIRKLLDGTNNFDNGLQNTNSSYYPIIVLHDPMFDSPGLNKILNDVMAKELETLQNDGLNTALVRPLTLINIDILIQLASSIASGLVTFKEILEHYFTTLTAKPQPGLHSYEQAEQLASDAVMPFSLVAYNYMQSRFGGEWQSKELLGQLLEKSEIG